ncbi:MAG: hypothetical protein Q8N52_04025, partial [Acidobacteriota bacterium]|nr:hypothetical protein [Acidobacteriota bacterium]
MPIETPGNSRPALPFYRLWAVRCRSHLVLGIKHSKGTFGDGAVLETDPREEIEMKLHSRLA